MVAAAHTSAYDVNAIGSGTTACQSTLPRSRCVHRSAKTSGSLGVKSQRPARSSSNDSPPSVATLRKTTSADGTARRKAAPCARREASARWPRARVRAARIWRGASASEARALESEESGASIVMHSAPASDSPAPSSVRLSHCHSARSIREIGAELAVCDGEADDAEQCRDDWSWEVEDDLRRAEPAEREVCTSERCRAHAD